MVYIKESLSMPALIGMPGPLEWIIIAVIVLVIFGPKKLPEFGKAIGQSIKELRKATSAKDKQKEEKEN